TRIRGGRGDGRGSYREGAARSGREGNRRRRRASRGGRERDVASSTEARRVAEGDVGRAGDRRPQIDRERGVRPRGVARGGGRLDVEREGPVRREGGGRQGERAAHGVGLA